MQDKLLKWIIYGIEEKKGKGIVSIDLRNIENSVCDYFVICHGDSSTQVNAIAGSIEKEVRENLNEKVNHTEGFENAEWLLLDYFNIVVHVFQKESRDFYNLESLWADGKFTKIADKF